MRLAQLDQRILRLAAEPRARRTIVTQCQLAGHEPLNVCHALIELLNAGLINSLASRAKPGLERAPTYLTTAAGAAALQAQLDRYVLQ